jgi:TatD DNase family protein
MEFFDSHCHLDPQRYGEDLPDVLSRARAAGVTGMAVIGTRAADSEAASALAAREPGIVCAAGIHPNDVHEIEPGEWDRITRLVASGAVAAIGETGLDWYRDAAPRELQRDYFAGPVAAPTPRLPRSVVARYDFGHESDCFTFPRGIHAPR